MPLLHDAEGCNRLLLEIDLDLGGERIGVAGVGHLVESGVGEDLRHGFRVDGVRVAIDLPAIVAAGKFSVMLCPISCSIEASSPVSLTELQEAANATGVVNHSENIPADRAASCSITCRKVPSGR